MVCGQVAFLLLLIHLSSGDRSRKPSEFRNEILRHYDKTLPPNSNAGYRLYFSFLQLLDMDDDIGALSIRLFLSISWKDERFQWDVDKSIRMGQLSLSPEVIWKPHHVHLNRVKVPLESKQKAITHGDGTMYYGGPTFLYTVCVPNLRYFPFDQQECHFDFGVWSEQAGGQLNSSRSSATWSIKNNRWEVLKSGTDKAVYSVADVFEYPVQRVTMNIRRSLPLLALSIVCPGLVCGLLGLLPFWMEPTSGTRMALGGTSLVLLTNLFQKMGKLIPSGGDVTPILVLYCVTCYVSVFLSTLQTVVAARWDRKSSVTSPTITGFIHSLPSPFLNFVGLAARASPSSSDQQQLVEDEEERVQGKDEEGGVIWWSHLVAMADLIAFGLHLLVFGLLTLSVCITE